MRADLDGLGGPPGETPNGPVTGGVPRPLAITMGLEMVVMSQNCSGGKGGRVERGQGRPFRLQQCIVFGVALHCCLMIYIIDDCFVCCVYDMDLFVD